jgi:hypothetical protein
VRGTPLPPWLGAVVRSVPVELDANVLEEDATLEGLAQAAANSAGPRGRTHWGCDSITEGAASNKDGHS